MKKKEIEVKKWHHSNGQVRCKMYTLNKKAHNPDGPAILDWNQQGQLIHEDYIINDKHHRLDGPANIWWDGDGKLTHEEYWVNGKLHREGGPSNRYWHKEKLIDERYYINGKLHREDGPALRKWASNWPNNKNIYYEVNFINAKLTRINGYGFRFYIGEELVHQL